MVAQPPAFPNRTCGFPASGSPPSRPFRAKGRSEEDMPLVVSDCRAPRPSTRSLVPLPRPPLSPVALFLATPDPSLASRPFASVPAAACLASRGRQSRRALAYSVLRGSLARLPVVRPSGLRPLRSSRLSAGVSTTMSRSDSSAALGAWLPLPSQFRTGGGRSAPRSRRGLPRSRTPLFPPSQRQPRDGLLCGASPSSSGWPTRAAESRSLSFRARVWLGPFTAPSRESVCLCLSEVLPLHRSSGGI